MTLEILTHDLLAPFRHGFFTRRGGASSGVFRGLNCGLGSSDQRDIVAINRGRVSDAMGLGAGHLVHLEQVHSARAVVAQAHDTGRGADGHATAQSGLGLAILTADCMPILLADAEAGVVGAAHAGWRGAAGGIIEATVGVMEVLGARPDRIAAVIGPSISQDNYEVGPELRDTFVAADPAAEAYFAPGRGDRLLLDLPGYGLRRLRRAGIGAADWIGACTYADPDRFYSFRRATHRMEADYGRLVSVIRA